MPLKARVLIALLAIFTIILTTGCVRQLEPTGMASGSCPAPTLGIIVDDNLQVLGVVPNSAAESAGVLVGDVLVDLTWIKLEPQPGCNDVGMVDASASPLPMPTSMIVEVEQPPHPTEPVPFTDRTTISEMMQYGATMRLRLLRAGVAVEVIITPTVPRPQPQAPGTLMPTPTPIPVPNDYL